MIATRSQVRSTSAMMCDERKTVRPSSRASRTSPKNVCWTSGSRPDVGSSRISRSGRCWSATTSPTFCLLPLRVLAEAPARVEVERVDQPRDVGPVDAAAQVPEVLDRLGAGQAVVQVELAGQVADPAMDRDRIGGRLDAEHLGAAGGRTDEVEQDAHRRRLARAVGPEEAEDLALGDLEVELDDASVLAVGLGQAFGLDDGGHGTSLPGNPSASGPVPAARVARHRARCGARTAATDRPARLRWPSSAARPATIPMLPTTARTISTATTSIDAVSSGSWRPAANSTMSGSEAPT